MTCLYGKGLGRLEDYIEEAFLLRHLHLMWIHAQVSVLLVPVTLVSESARENFPTIENLLGKYQAVPGVTKTHSVLREVNY